MLKNQVSRRDFISNSGKVAAASVLAGRSSLEEQAVSPSTTPPPEDCIAPEDEPQYKRRCKRQIAKLEDGNIDAAIACLEHHLAQSPLDVEYLYGLAVAHTMKGDTDRALLYVQRSLDGGLPFSRFQAGPRQFLRALYEDNRFDQLVDQYGSQLVHGPLLGSVTDTSARVWIRSWQETSFRIWVSRSRDMLEATATPFAQTRASEDFTGIASIGGLSDNTTYYYQIEFDNTRLPAIYTFNTFPATGQPAVFEIGFGGCAGYTPWHERIWRQIASYHFPLFLLTGDNVYIDDPTRPGVQDYVYYRRQSRPEFRALIAGTSIAAIWDDHEFGDDDSWGGPEIAEPAWKLPVWRTFRRNWNNPSYAGGDALPGCWFSFSVADVDFFMLDDRFYRDNHNEPPMNRPPTMLGPQQKAWLFESLKQSRATFKVLVTSVPWAYGVKPGSNDPWQGFKAERDEIFGFLSSENINGVFLLSGDRHRADIWKIDRPDGYPLYDFENARLTNIHTHQLIPGAVLGYNEKCTFGRLRFDTTLSDPEVTYDIITIDNEIVHSFPLKLSQITGG